MLERGSINTGGKGEQQTYLVGSGSNKSVISKVATYISGDDLAVYAITRHKIHILAWRIRRSGLGASRALSS